MEITETPLVVTNEAPPQPAAVPDLSEAAVRAAVQAEDSAMSQAVKASEQPQPVNQAANPVDVPAKFKNPDGTVDVSKIEASTKQLDEAIQQKQEALKTIEDYMAQYREKEKEFRNLPNPQKLAAQIAPEAPVVAQQPSIPPDLRELEKQIAEDYQRDPIKTMIDLQRAIVKKELEPIMEWRERQAQEEREMAIKSNLAQLAQSDPRILKPEIFQEVNREIESDPAYRRLKNPYKAAWNEVKERMRLSEPSPAQAQLSKPSTPILGGGTPPPVPSQFRSNPNITDYMSAIQTAKTKEETANLEVELRRFLDRIDRGQA